MPDLVLVVADKNMHFALQGALTRHQALGIRPISTEFIVHPHRDSGVRKTGADLLKLRRRSASRGLLVLDYEGSGSDVPPLTLETDLDNHLRPLWGTSAKAIVIDPEVDVWMWGSDNALRTILQWPDAQTIRDWLRARDYVFNEHDKPERPKEALEAVMTELRRPRSSADYEEIAARISLQNCQDAAFGRLRTQLREWFPSS